MLYARRITAPAKMRIAAAASGGVDSTCAMLLLKKQGYEVFALHGLFTPNARPAPHLSQICRDMEIPLVIVDLKKHFARHVIEPFARDYAKGLTPNPCAACNRHIKFGALLDAALALGANRMATGHYARLILAKDKGLVARAADARKDQSYFLGLVSPQKLARAIFPLAELEKPLCRRIVARAFPHIPKENESRDLCFARGSWHEFLLARPDFDMGAPGPAVLVDREGKKQVIGMHKGLWRYTEGQRKGLGLPWKEPLYVLGKNIAENELLLRAKNEGDNLVLQIGRPNFFVEPAKWPSKIFAKLRHRQQPAACHAHPEDDGLILEIPHFAGSAAPGQVAAIYDGAGLLLAAGLIAAN